MTTMSEPRTWTLTIAAPCPWPTANGRGHTIAISHLVRPWRKAAFEAAMVARLPKGLDRVRIETEARFPGRAPVRDRLNLYPTIKSVVDGLGPSRVSLRTPHAVGWGLVMDDDDQHVDGPYIAIGPKLTNAAPGTLGQLTVTITDISRAQLDEVAQLLADNERLTRDLATANAAGRVLANDLRQRDSRIANLEEQLAEVREDLARLRMVRG